MHGLCTLAWLHEQQAATDAFNTRIRANDPSRKAERRLAEAIEEGRSLLDALTRNPGLNVVTDETAWNEANDPTPPAQDWSVASVEDDYWVLPLTLSAVQIAAALFPAGTRRYGLHYICDNPETRSIAASLIIARED